MPRKTVKSGKKGADAINFERMIANALKGMNGAELDPAASAALKSMMNGMVDNITEEAIKKAGGEGATLDDIKEAARKIAPESLVNQAVAEMEGGQEGQQKAEMQQ